MRIAVLEDDSALTALYRSWFSVTGHVLECFETVAEFRKALRSDSFDLLLLDWELPDGTGSEVLEFARDARGWELPILCVSVRDSEPDVVRALRAGADDYVVKPPRGAELLARIEALGRLDRRTHTRAPEGPSLELDDASLTCRIGGGTPIDLTAKEFALAAYLLRNVGRLVSRRRLMEAVWGVVADLDTRTVDSHISRLRTKLKLRPDAGWDLRCLYGRGYRLQRIARSPASRPAAVTSSSLVAVG